MRDNQALVFSATGSQSRRQRMMVMAIPPILRVHQVRNGDIFITVLLNTVQLVYVSSFLLVAPWY